MKTLSLKLFTRILFVLFFLTSINIFAHCDGIDGPVVKAAKKALETNNVNLALIWVDQKDENIIKDAFIKTMKVRKLNKDAQQLADYYFFETLVRIHRQGEGEPYTGLKPAGRDLGPVIPASDLSIEKNSFEPIQSVFLKAGKPTEEIQILFNKVMNLKNYDPNDVDAGRKYVKAYVAFLHKGEEIYGMVSEDEKN